MQAGPWPVFALQDSIVRLTVFQSLPTLRSALALNAVFPISEACHAGLFIFRGGHRSGSAPAVEPRQVDPGCAGCRAIDHGDDDHRVHWRVQDGRAAESRPLACVGH